jgi:SAM-dependent methyltransferase
MEQRFAFDQVASVYSKARPDYPHALVDDVVSYARLKPDDAILEVGCGTGQATKSFATRGFSILAVDPGPEMVRAARATLAQFGNVALVESTFEALPTKRASFQLIIAAQSWHWVAPEVRFVKAAEALSPHGALAVFGHVPVGLPAPLLEQFEQIYRHHIDYWGPPPEAWYCPAAPSRAGSTSRDCSGPSSTSAIRGNGSTRRQATRISCVRDRIIG